jgi:aerobic-type carbon monoxide dehydrogenase small subunit (CoxS/CutS family)
MSEEKNNPRKISRREFLRDAGIVVGGTAVSSAFFLSACGKEVEVTKTVTTTAPGSTSTVTTTAPGTPGATVTAPGTTKTITKYTCPVCNQEFDSLEALKAHFDSVHEGAEPAAENIINLTVNGKEYTLRAEPNWTLLKVIREIIGLTGTKKSCDEGACGMCTVIKDGAPVLSCLLLAIECSGANIVTIEAVAGKESLDPVQESFVQHNVPQCGFCQPSMVLMIKDLLSQKKSPTEEEIIRSISGIQCRCGTYPRVIKATQSIAGRA